ncbi:hypothetical protein [Kitasatospora griseola]|uniref:hypothetical protein n=1 Tax=Kitasatospora griseola TaxID=2064 RepID=UPI00364B5994
MNSDAHEKEEDGPGGEQADRKRCEVCGTALPRRQGRGRPARYCTDSASCRSKASRARQRATRLGDDQLLAALRDVAPMRPGAADGMTPGPLQRVAALGEALGGAAYHYTATVQAGDDSTRALERLRQAVALFSGRLLEAAEQAHLDALADPPISQRAENTAAPRRAADLGSPAISARTENAAASRPTPADPDGPPRPRPGAAPAEADLDGPAISTRTEKTSTANPPLPTTSHARAVDSAPRLALAAQRTVPFPADLGEPDLSQPFGALTAHAWRGRTGLVALHRGRQRIGWVQQGLPDLPGWAALVDGRLVLDAVDREPLLAADAQPAADLLVLALRQGLI